MESNKKQRTVSRKLLKNARASVETDSAAVAGKIWTIAHSLMESQSQISSKQYSQAKVSASTAASTARTLMDSDVFDAALLDRVIKLQVAIGPSPMMQQKACPTLLRRPHKTAKRLINMRFHTPETGPIVVSPLR